MRRQITTALTGLSFAVPAAFAGWTAHQPSAGTIEQMAEACRAFLADSAVSSASSSSWAPDWFSNASSEESSSSRASSESAASTFSCEPFVCRDGTTRPSCTPDGRPIDPVVDPCFLGQSPSIPYLIRWEDPSPLCDDGSCDVEEAQNCLEDCGALRG